MGAEVSGRKGLGKILEYGLRLKLEDGSICREAGGFSRSVLPCKASVACCLTTSQD